MKFVFVDRILELTRGARIVAVKAVTQSEEYLADHFPTFPVLPGVLMLEVLAESAAWLVLEARDFDPVVVLLQEARNVTYKSFVRPGDLLRVEVNCRRIEPERSEFDGVGFSGETEVVRARFSMKHLAVEAGATGFGGGSGNSADEIRKRFARLAGNLSRNC